MQPQTTSTTSSLDPQAVMLAKAIRQTESGGDFAAKGKSGEYGAYQYTAPTWMKDSAEAGVNVPLERATPEQQNQVAYTKIKKLKDSGLNVGQISSAWNAGEGEPDAYLGKFSDGSPSVGVNKQGVKFDVPAYSKSVATAYQKLKAGQNVGVDPKNPSSVQPQQDDQEGLLHKILDFAFPIAGDVGTDVKALADPENNKRKSALQQLGDLGLSALWFAPGVGAEAEAGIRGAGLLGETGAKIAGQAIGGGAIGYGADVSSHLSQGQTGAGVFKPGAGTLTGGAVGGLIGKVASKYGETGVIDAISKENNSVLGQTKPGGLRLAESQAKGQDTGSFLARKGINLKAHIDPSTVSYDVKDAAGNLRGDAKSLDSVLTDSLKGISEKVDLNTEEQKALEAISKNPAFNKTAAKLSAAQQYVKAQFAAERERWGDAMPLANYNEFKSGQWEEAKFDMTKPSFAPKVHRTIGNSAKTTVEDIASRNGLTGVKEMNEYIGSHYNAADALYNGKATGRLHGTKAAGGRLGDMLRGHAMGVIGSIGGSFGGGPLQAILGGLTGEIGSKALARVLRYTSSSPIKSALMKKMLQEDPEVVSKVLQYAKKTPVGKQVETELQKAASSMGVKPQALDAMRGRQSAAGLGETKSLAGLAKKGTSLTKKQGGVTINLRGEVPNEGYVYAPSKATERVVPLKTFSQKDTLKYTQDHISELQQPGAHLGLWVDNGQVYLDVSRVEPDIGKAVNGAKKAQQLGIYDIKNGKTIEAKDYETARRTGKNGGQNTGGNSDGGARTSRPAPSAKSRTGVSTGRTKTSIAPMLAPKNGRSPFKGLVSRVAQTAIIKGIVQ